MYGNVTLDSNLQVSESTYLNRIYMISNDLKTKIKENLDKILGENSGVVKRNTTSVIHKIYKRRQLKVLEQVVYIIF